MVLGGHPGGAADSQTWSDTPGIPGYSCGTNLPLVAVVLE